MKAGSFLRKKQRITPRGLHHFRGEGDFARRRIHLRCEPDGSGILVLDASKILHLNQTAIDFIYLFLSGFEEDGITDKIKRKYNVSRKRVRRDLEEIRNTVKNLLEDSPACPVTYIGLDRIEPFKTPVSAPYRMDIALTYRCNVDCAHCYNVKKDSKELREEEWKIVLNKLWDTGIPHVVFTGGEPTLRNDLPVLISHAESLGMVTGLLTNGVRLYDRKYLKKLKDMGLDHVQITLESSDALIHNRMVGAETFEKTVAAIKNCIEENIYVITNTTITKKNAKTLPGTVEFLSDMGLQTFAVNSIIYSGNALEGDFALKTDQLIKLLSVIREIAEKRNLRMIWYTPTRYCSLNPVELELGPKRCTAGVYNLCIEPDGSVLPCQSYYESAGNILMDEWESIYNHPVMKRIRNRDWVDTECRDCENFDLCGGGCPLETEMEKAIRCCDSMSNG